MSLGQLRTWISSLSHLGEGMRLDGAVNQRLDGLHDIEYDQVIHALSMSLGSWNSGVGLGYVRLKISAKSRVSSRCCSWSSPTGTYVVLLYFRRRHCQVTLI